MQLPTYFTKQTNADISKAIKSLLTVESSNASELVENHGFSFYELAKSLDKLRPSGSMSFGQLKKTKNVISAAKRFVKVYSN
jgi:hypothetical protein